MIKKGSIVIFGWFFLGLLYSCCSEVLEYFDPGDVVIEIVKSDLTMDDSLSFYLINTDIEYLASARNINGFSSAFATSCPKPGNQGMKYPYTKIEFTSDTDFDEEHLVGDLLNDIMFVSKFTNDTLPIVEMDISTLYDFYSSPEFFIFSSPVIPSQHIITAKLFKSNGEVLVTESDTIVWQ